MRPFSLVLVFPARRPLSRAGACAAPHADDRDAAHTEAQVVEIWGLDLIPSGSAFAMNKPECSRVMSTSSGSGRREMLHLPKARVRGCPAGTKELNKFGVYQIELLPSGRILAREGPELKEKSYVFHTWKEGKLLTLRQTDVKQCPIAGWAGGLQGPAGGERRPADGREPAHGGRRLGDLRRAPTAADQSRGHGRAAAQQLELRRRPRRDRRVRSGERGRRETRRSSEGRAESAAAKLGPAGWRLGFAPHEAPDLCDRLRSPREHFVLELRAGPATRGLLDRRGLSGAPPRLRARRTPCDRCAPGEGIGPEVIGSALDVLSAVESCGGARFEVRTGGAIGHEAERRSGRPLTDEVSAFCEDVFGSGAILRARRRPIRLRPAPSLRSLLQALPGSADRAAARGRTLKARAVAGPTFSSSARTPGANTTGSGWRRATAAKAASASTRIATPSVRCAGFWTWRPVAGRRTAAASRRDRQGRRHPGSQRTLERSGEGSRREGERRAFASWTSIWRPIG